MEQINQLKTQFNAVKETFTTQEKAVVARIAEQAKYSNILDALRKEMSELLDRTKGKLERGETLTADEYVELKQSDTGLKARIEYYEAVAEDFEKLLYDEKVKLFDIQQELISIRERICYSQASEKIKSFFDKNQEELNEIFNLLYFSGDFTPSLYSDETKDDLIISHLQKTLSKSLSLKVKTPEEMTIYSEHLANFERKTPTQLHLERFQPPKGLSRLLSQEMEK